MWYVTFSGILFSLKKVGIRDIWDNLGEPGGHNLSEIRQS